ncbi:hypothetical protein SAMN05660776_2446 [Salegentibacter holothuriorum]|uniref:DUF2357 domain-containing protein n=1 Tax=Salegentibacter holothuriorum TaxID=241145 RepID=A0A1T5D685_9FLAO|nr:DUF2357 domain-containing protein [Salegentibacter holothuriorum]SKB67136.1 hypothetical protein SAMN05660776_2446 [Salegentibacter holothuriorum]
MQDNKLNIPLDHIQDGLSLEVVGNNSNPLFYYTDAQYNGEAPYQIMEGRFYHYRFSKKEYCFEPSEVVEPSPFSSSEGRLTPNIYTGTLELNIFKSFDIEVGSVGIEVQSVKASYREDYRFMLEAITDKCTDLLMQANSPVSHNFEADFSNENEGTIYQRFAFIKSIINSDEFKESIYRIITFPSTTWMEELETTDSRKIRRFKNSELRQLINRNPRAKLPLNHPLSKRGLNSMPTRIETTRKIDTVDTPENRFIKHALQTYLKLCSTIISNIKTGTRLFKEVEALSENIENQLSHSFFQEISRPHTLKLNSPVLQRKEGYREVLRSWLMFDLAAKLVWKGGEDVYKANKRDVATLYEYWLFFTLLDMISEIFDIKGKETSQLIKKTNDGLGLQLRQGRHTALKGVYKSGTRNLNIKFSFNRTFSGKKKFPKSGSWTKSMRPDYTLSIWPEEINEDQAENEELIVHLHFDAKYKIEKLIEIIDAENIGSNEDLLSSEKKEERKGKYKNADLFKMHTYKDAIRRTGGAYVLYPGEEKLTEKGFHELIPGLGAFPVRPNKTDNGTSDLKVFILDVLDHFLNRASQRENMAFRTFDIHKKKPNNLKESIPEAYGKNRNFIPDETFVLIGGYKSLAHLEWIEETGLYNFRMDSERGSIILDQQTVSAKYLLIHTFNEIVSGKLFKINSRGPKVYSGTRLHQLGYPFKDSGKGKNYLVVEIAPVEDEEFKNLDWKFSKLKNYKRGRESFKPFTSTLTELMNTINS